MGVKRLRYFWNYLETYSLTKLAQILGSFLFFFFKNCFGSFLGNVGEN